MNAGAIKRYAYLIRTLFACQHEDLTDIADRGVVAVQVQKRPATVKARLDVARHAPGYVPAFPMATFSSVFRGPVATLSTLRCFGTPKRLHPCEPALNLRRIFR